jgi:HSP20 family molecular chaperone IbpA
MDSRSRDWIWSEAIEMLRKLERLHGQSFAPGSSAPGQTCWEPPIDMLETDEEILIIIALPGVDLDQVVTRIEDGTLVIVGHRRFPAELRHAIIHRLELPQGRFERRLTLPPGRYGAARQLKSNGCLVVTLRKASATGGLR